MWEYLMLVLRPDADETAAQRALNSRGREGWELVEALSAGANYIRFVFKRKLD